MRPPSASAQTPAAHKPSTADHAVAAIRIAEMRQRHFISESQVCHSRSLPLVERAASVNYSPSHARKGGRVRRRKDPFDDDRAFVRPLPPLCVGHGPDLLAEDAQPDLVSQLFEPVRVNADDLASQPQELADLDFD